MPEVGINNLKGVTSTSKKTSQRADFGTALQSKCLIKQQHTVNIRREGQPAEADAGREKENLGALINRVEALDCSQNCTQLSALWQRSVGKIGQLARGHTDGRGNSRSG